MAPAPWSSDDPGRSERLTSRNVPGYCPMGCGQTLIRASGGHITCTYLPCPEPDAACMILNDPETEHVVKFTAGDFTIRHPLRERLRDELMTCDLHDFIAHLSGPPVAPGRYRAIRSSSTDRPWLWHKLEEATSS